METWLYAIILGFVQGVAEFLPISSSGHLIVISWLVEGHTLSLSLNVALHLGTLLAILIYFRADWFSLLNSSVELIRYKKRSFEANVLLPALLVGTIPAAIVGLLFKDTIELYLHHPHVVVYTLVIVGLLLWGTDRYFPATKQFNQIKIKDGICIGLLQVLALIPGVSRSGSTIIAGRLRCIEREAAAKFSFMLGTPAMLGAVVLEAGNIIQSLNQPMFYIGLVTSFLVGCAAINFFLSFVRKRGLGIFAIYRILLALCTLYLLD